MVTGERDFLNFLKIPDDMETEGFYDIPKLKGIILKKPEKVDMIQFNYCLSTPKAERHKKTVHFFLGDYLFERVWTHLNQNTELLKQFKFVLGPNFSQYTDMPRALRIYNQYRTAFVSAYWQRAGIPVIPTLNWSTRDTFEYSFDGMPKNSCLAVSSVGCVRKEKIYEQVYSNTINPATTLFHDGIEYMIDRLHPKQLIWYGIIPRWAEKLIQDEEIELIHRKSNSTMRFEKYLDERKAQ